MFAVNTAEVRWFNKGDIPEQFLAWFKGLEGIYEDQAVRSDFYLKMTEESNLGIKIREGRFEIKRLTSNLGILSSKGAEGIADTWRKWSLKADDKEEIDIIAEDTGQWIEIEKKRMMQKFRTDESGRLIPQVVSFLPSSGIGVELSRVFFRSQKYWTFGMEAFGMENEIFDLLKRCFNHCFSKKPPTALTLDHSFSYPEWLHYLSSRE